MAEAHVVSSVGTRPAESQAKFQRLVARHFDPVGGSTFWLERERETGICALDELRRPEDLDVFGIMDEDALRDRSVWDFVPKCLQADLAGFITSETGGTLGQPKRTVFNREDFQAAFVTPFVAAVDGRIGFPRGARWAWIGPGGPHVVGKAAREVCRAMGSPDPFAIDFDPRWFKAQTAASFTRKRYMQHVINQAVAIFRQEPIDVLFSTPPVVVELGKTLPEAVRSRVAAVHLGGLSVEQEQWESMRAAYPRAVFHAGYGNSLLGMCPQLECTDLHKPRYYPHGDRLHIRFVPPETKKGSWQGETVDYGERGRVLATRLDESFLIVNLLERDVATRLPPDTDCRELGFVHDGIGDPRPRGEVPRDRLGIY